MRSATRRGRRSPAGSPTPAGSPASATPCGARARPTSAATRALLEHLERVGFDGAPRYPRRDDRGREVLSFIPGEAAIEPYPDWALTDEALVSVADCCAATTTRPRRFDPRGHAGRDSVPARFRDGLVCHNDPNLDNVVFAGGRAVGADRLRPRGPRLGGLGRRLRRAAVGAAARRARRCPSRCAAARCARLRLFADAYGLPDGERARLPAATRSAHTWAYDVVRGALADGHGAFRRFWDEGGRTRAERTAAGSRRTSGPCSARSSTPFDTRPVGARLLHKRASMCSYEREEQPWRTQATPAPAS